MAALTIDALARADRNLRASTNAIAPRGGCALNTANQAASSDDSCHVTNEDVAQRNGSQSGASAQASTDAALMPARCSRPATPPPPSAEYARFGATVSLTAWLPPAMPSDEEIYAYNAACSALVAHVRFERALNELQADLQSRASVPLRRVRVRA